MNDCVGDMGGYSPYSPGTSPFSPLQLLLSLPSAPRGQVFLLTEEETQGLEKDP